MHTVLARTFFIGTVSVLALAALPAISQTVGINAAVRNIVTMKTKADPAAHRAKVKERVSLGDMIESGKASTLQVLLLDRTTLTVGPNSTMRVDRFVYDPNRKSSAVGASVAKGAFRFMSGKSVHGAPGQSTITTPVASIGIRGTIVEGFVGEEAVATIGREGLDIGAAKVDPATASLIVLRGPGQQARGTAPGGIDVTAGGKSVAVDGSGLAVFVPGPGQAPIGPFKLSNLAYNALDKMLRSSPNIVKVSPANSPSPLIVGGVSAVALLGTLLLTDNNGGSAPIDRPNSP
jgi:FecR protein